MLKSLDIKAFGKLRDLKFTFHEKVNLIYGQNEAGKSTLAAAVSSVLMGFSPAKGENHPYMPWNQDSIVIEAEITDALNGYLVQRSLKASPSGFMFSRNQKEKINNLPLPMMQFLSKEVFSAVFAMKHDTLNGEILKSKNWQEIKEHFMFALAQDQIQSPSRVLDGLENQKKSLFKQDNKGSQKIKVLQRQLKESQTALKDALAGYEQYEMKALNLEALRTQYKCLKEDLEALQFQNSQLELVLPIKRVSNQLEHLLLKNPLLHDPAVLKKIIEGSKSRLVLQEGLRQGEQQLKEDLNLRDALYLDQTLLTAADEALLIDRVACESLNKAVEEARIMEPKRTNDRESIQTTETYISIQFIDVFQLDYKPIYQESILELQLSEIAQRFQALRMIRQQEVQEETAPKKGVGFLILMGGLWALTGYFVLTSALSIALALSIAGLVTGSFAMSLWLFKQQRLAHQWFRRFQQKESTELQIEGICGELIDLLSPFVSSKNQVLLLGDAFVQQLIQLKTLIQKKKSLLESERTFDLEIEALTQQIKAFESKHGCSVLESTRQLETITQKKQKMLIFNEKCHYIDQRIFETNERTLKLQETINQEASAIETILGMSYDTYANNEKFYLESLSRYEELIEEKELLNLTLGSLSAYENSSLEEVLVRKMKVVNDIEAMNLQEVRLYGDIKSEESECRHLREKDDYVELLANNGAIEIALEDAKQEYARVSILIELIRYTDEVYKAMYQPEYLKHASAYFKSITQHRYTEIIIDEQDQVLLMRSGCDMPMETIQSLSSGTLNQLYFSLFLSLSDTLDPEYRLPLFLDDVFLSWDDERFLAGVEVIRQISEKRQLFLLSCNKLHTKRLEETFNAVAFEL